MAKTLKLSINELWALLTRTFEALYGHERDYYDMARTVLWLECHGHGGVMQLVKALPLLENMQLSEPVFSEQSREHFLIDGQGHSLLCIGRSVADLSMAFAAYNDLSRIELINAHDSQSFIGLLSYIASHGFKAKLIYKDRVAIIQPQAKHPTLYETNAGDDFILTCSQDTDLPDEGLPGENFTGESLKVLKTIEVQKTSYENGLENGLHISQAHYDALNHIANRVLVEATEASRKGAGE